LTSYFSNKVKGKIIDIYYYSEKIICDLSLFFLTLHLHRKIGFQPIPTCFTTALPFLRIGMDLAFLCNFPHANTALLHGINLIFDVNGLSYNIIIAFICDFRKLYSMGLRSI
jgi:hypothetical protein